jgi:Uma2 family endonuclease
VLTLDRITWEDYEHVLECLQKRPGLRVTSDSGRLDNVTTSRENEEWKELILRLVQILCEELRTELQSYGGLTRKLKEEQKGAEADTCFYVINAAQVVGKRKLDLSNDPPPDIVVEIDKSNQSLHKFPIYAAFGVPEIWRCNIKRNAIQFYELRSEEYIETTSSRFFPILTSAVLTKFIDQSHSDGHMSALVSFRSWVRKTLER